MLLKRLVLVCSCVLCGLSWVRRRFMYWSQNCVVPVSRGQLGWLQMYEKKQAVGLYCGKFLYKVIRWKYFHRELQVSCCEITQILLLCFQHLHLQVFRLKFEDDASVVISNSEQIISLLFPVCNVKWGRPAAYPNSFSSVAYFSHHRCF